MTDREFLTCEQMFRQLNDYLDRELSPENVERVEAHLAECDICAKEFTFDGQVLDGIRQKMRRPELPTGLAAKIAALLETAKSSDR